MKLWNFSNFTLWNFKFQLWPKIPLKLVIHEKILRFKKKSSLIWSQKDKGVASSCEWHAHFSWVHFTMYLSMSHQTFPPPVYIYLSTTDHSTLCPATEMKCAYALCSHFWRHLHMLYFPHGWHSSTWQVERFKTNEQFYSREKYPNFLSKFWYLEKKGLWEPKHLKTEKENLWCWNQILNVHDIT